MHCKKPTKDPLHSAYYLHGEFTGVVVLDGRDHGRYELEEEHDVPEKRKGEHHEGKWVRYSWTTAFFKKQGAIQGGSAELVDSKHN